MNIRPASFRDLAAIEELHQASLPEVTGLPGMTETGEKPVPQATLLRLWYGVSKTISSLVPITDTGDALYVAELPREGIVGFIQAQAASGKPKAWQILNLCVAQTPSGHFAKEQLLTELCNRGMELGISRYMVRLPLDHPLLNLFLTHGFTQYATEQILYRDDPPQHLNSGLALRPAKRDDIGAIYLLYQRTTPSHVANLEAPSLKSWQESFAQGVMSRIGKDDVRHFVAEKPGVTAWAGIRPAAGARPTLMSLMCDGHDASLRQEFVVAALSEIPQAPVTCVLRHYDSELIRELQRHGFAIYGTQLLLMRDLAVKVKLKGTERRKKPVLVHAGLAQTVPTTTNLPNLRVFRTSNLRRDQRSSRK